MTRDKTKAEALDALRSELLLRRLKKSAQPRMPQDGQVGQLSIEPVDRSQPLELSWAQQRLWFIDQLEGNDSAAGRAYHIPGAIRLQGQLDLAALQAALDAIIARHEVLRTRIVTREGHPVQEIVPASDAGFSLQQSDLSIAAIPAGQREDEARRQIGEEALAPFDLACGPLIRGRLIKLEANEYILCVVMHHIVSDGWSIGVLIREFAELYSAFRHGRENPLPPLPIQYADYAAWQRQWLSGETLQNQLAWWKQHLAGAPELLELPTDHPRPPQQSHRGDSVSFSLNGELCSGLKKLAKCHDATLFMTLYTGWAILLGRLSGQDDLVIGAPVANRQRSEVEGLIGFFVNTLALRCDLSADPSVNDLLKQVKDMTLAAYSHQDVPFDQVVEAIKPVRSMSHSPVFQAMFALQNTPQSELQLPGLKLVHQEIPRTTAQFDLSLILQENGNGNGMVGSLDYASDLFDRATIERWIGHLQSILRAMVQDAEGRVHALPMLDAAERRQLLEAFNPAPVEYPQDELIHRQFEAQAKQNPNAIAVTCAGQTLSYAELNGKANQLAHHLSNQGIGPDKLVAICVDRSLEMIVGLLGILKAGGAYVPLDSSYPQERIEYMLEDAAPQVLLTQQHLKAALPNTKARIIALDADWKQIDAQPQTNLKQTGQTPQSLAYLIYTSGSTGKPKGVMVEHRNVARLFSATDDWYRFDQTDVWTMFHSFAFDFSVWEIWGALLYGGRLVIVPHDTTRNPQAFYRLLCEEGVTILNQTPSAFRQLIAAQAEEKGQHKLRAIIFGGEALELSMLKPWVARNGVQQPQLINMYGITETTVHVTYRPLTQEDIDHERGSPIGKAIPDLRIYLLDANKQPVPLGVAGEMYVGGAGVARGYLNRPELTHERFIPDPFSSDPNSRLYKTGDLGRWKADGNLEYLGRNDHQVKIRGFRIELGEIDAQLSRQPGIREAVVIAREAPGGASHLAVDKRLVAYLTTRDGNTPDIESIRSDLKHVLPDYMVPSAFVVLDSLPLTPNGKLDRKALPAPEQGAYASRRYEAPQGEIEETLAAIWQDILHLGEHGKVGRHDNFFDLGGHSLLIIQMQARLRQAGLTIDVRSVFTHPTPAALAASLGTGSAATANFTVPPNRIPAGCTEISPAMLSLASLDQEQLDRIVATVPGGAANIQDIYPLAPLQEGILFHHLLSRQSDAYILPVLMACDSRAHLDAFHQALQHVIDRHDILRSAIVWQGMTRPMQVVYRQTPVPREEIHLDPDRDTRAQLDALIAPQQLWMDLQQAPLICTRIAQDPHSPRCYLILQLHHIVSDHISLEIMIGEVIARLAGQTEEQPPANPYREFVAHALAQAAHNDDETFFRQRLADIDEPTAPFGLLDIHGDGSQIDEARRDVDQTLAQRLRHTARRLQTSAATLFHVASALVIARCSNRTDVVFGSVLSGRLQGTAGAERMLGMFINTLPLRLDLQDASVEQIVRHTQQELIELIRHEQASLTQAQHCSGIQGNAPLFSTLLNYRHSEDKSDNPDTSRTQATNVPADHFGIEILASHERTNYPITLSVDDLGEGFAITAQTDRRIDPKRITAYLHTALEGLVDALDRAPETPLLQLGILPQEELKQLQAFNAASRSYPQDELIHRQFEAQAKQHPNAIAVTCAGQSLTYAELNQKSNQLAHHLIQQGIGPDSLVAICVDRSLEMITGLLGILKAGGAYVPLDPSYPAERIEYMLEDAAPQVLLTQQHLKVALPNTKARIIALDADWKQIDAQPQTNLKKTHQTSQSLAYLIYTSGSTGKPKGVMVEHRNVARLFSATDDWYHFAQTDVWTMFHSFAFDFSVWEIWGALLYGGRLVIVPHDTTRNPTAFYRLLCEEGVTILNQTPSAFRQLIAAQAEEQGTHKLRAVIFGGEALELSILKPWVARNGDRQPQLINMYGITETTVHVTYRPLTQEDIDHERGSPIGKAIPDLRIYLLDANKQPVPLGVAGEMYVGGAGVARGYLNRPELTHERFIPDPFSSDPNSRLYKTGDLGRWKADGNLEYLGRNDHQVKIRGFRIELGEIEAQLSRQPGIREAVVLAREEQGGDKRLVAYLTGTIASLDTLRSDLKVVLPDYMVPSAFVVLDTLPLTPNGKLDRKALPSPDTSAYASRSYAAPQGEIEETLATIWQDILHLDGHHRIGRHDNFFDLGGHSLSAMQLAARLSSTFGRQIPVRQIFDTPALAEQAASLAHAGAALPPIEAAPARDYYPLSHAQRRLWFLAQIGNAEAAYNLPAAIRLRGPLDTTKMAQALGDLVKRHAPLRTTFIPMEGEPMQWIGEPYAVDLPVIPIAGKGTGKDAASPELRAALTGFALEPFNLETGPLLRARLYRLGKGEEDHILAVAVHHIVADGWAIELAIREVSERYAALCRQDRQDTLPPPLPPLPIEYVDYSLWQRQLLASGALDDQRDYWLQRLGGELPILQLPTDRPRPVMQSYLGGQYLHPISATLRKAIDRFCSERQVTPFMLLVALYQILLARLSGQHDILVGIPIAGRQHPQVGDLIGFFVNTLVLRADLRANPGSSDTTGATDTAPSFADLLTRTRSAALDAYAHQDYPFDLLVDELAAHRDLSRQAVFDTTFTLQTTSLQKTVDLGEIGLHVEQLGIDVPTAKFDLSAVVLLDEAHMTLALDYSTDLFDEQTIARFAGYYENLLTDALAHPDKAVSQLRLLGKEERRRLLEELPGQGQHYPIPAQDNLASRIARQAKERAGQVAITCEDQNLTYGELDRRSSQLAHHLIQQGVSPGTPVVLCLERGIDMIVAILGVLKAGGCYVPIEPGLPDERIRYQIADCGAGCVITQGETTARLKNSTNAAGQTIPHLCLDRDAQTIQAHAATAPVVRITPDQLAYVIYTSGSTGQPKGVQLSHANVLRLFKACEEHFDFDESQVWTLFHSYAFDFSVWEIFGALLYGGRLVIVPPAVARFPSAFAELLAREKVTLLSQTPSAFVRLLEGVQTGAGKDWAKHLRYVVFGGEALEYASLRPWYRHTLNPSTRLINMYGITETTVHVTWREVRQSEVEEGGCRSVGRPLADLTAYILDPHREPVPWASPASSTSAAPVSRAAT